MMTNDEKERLKKAVFNDEGYNVHDIKVYRGNVSLTFGGLCFFNHYFKINK